MCSFADVSVTFKAQRRLYVRFDKLSQTKPRRVATTAVARELVGLFWAALHLQNPLVTINVRACVMAYEETPGVGGEPMKFPCVNPTGESA